jgi:hypothetical protein
MYRWFTRERPGFFVDCGTSDEKMWDRADVSIPHGAHRVRRNEETTEAMPQDQHPNPEAGQPQAGEPVRNPYILNLCRALVEKKGEPLDPDAMEELLDEMYSLYEGMLGRNMVNNLPEPARKEYLDMAEDPGILCYEKIGAVFGASISNREQIMKDTMKQFAEIFMKSRAFNPEDYSTPVKEDS